MLQLLGSVPAIKVDHAAAMIASKRKKDLLGLNQYVSEQSSAEGRSGQTIRGARRQRKIRRITKDRHAQCGRSRQGATKDRLGSRRSARMVVRVLEALWDVTILVLIVSFDARDERNKADLSKATPGQKAEKAVERR